MYAKRIRIVNYGPIDQLDITLPFNGEHPKPILLVGENGSGKSIVLSHIVNGLMSMQGVVYPENSEIEKGKVYKIRSSLYIRSGSEYYWERVDFEKDLYCEEVILRRLKKDFLIKPADIIGANSFDDLWNSMNDEESSVLKNNFYSNDIYPNPAIKDIFNNNCVLYFPHNRFEEPAWLNEENLRTKAEYMTLKHTTGYTDRKIINYSSLHDNQNWLFEVTYDSNVFEKKTVSLPFNVINQSKEPKPILPIDAGYSGEATTIHNIAIDIARLVFGADGDLRFGITRRQNRKISLIRDKNTLVPNIFQLSSGEASLLNLFLSILRDFDLSYTSFGKIEDIRGIVIVDEIDLHLHTIHQYEILPKLIKKFPNIQFIVTTHSPFFVLGMEKFFGQDGFALYGLPTGKKISPEDFSEFRSAYQSFAKTKQFTEAIKNTQKPIVFLEGATDVRYLQKAAELLDRKEVLQSIQIEDGEGSGNLDKRWKFFNSGFANVIPQKVILLYDCDQSKEPNSKGNMFKQSIPKKENHPLKKGIENLFEKVTIEKARKHKPEFIDSIGAHAKTERGEQRKIPEEWIICKDEKTNLCTWLCENGDMEDFKHFEEVFDLLEKILTNSND